jgi:hypothetical protein
MALTAGLQLPFGIQPVNPTPVDAWSGPYSAATAQDAIDAANVAIPAAIRYQSMEVRLIVGGVSKKYWYRDGIADANLVEFASGSGSSGGSGGSTLLTELVLNETPTGAVDGVNTAYTLAYTPATASSVMLWLNGQLLTQGTGKDFTVASQTVTMSFPPQTGDVLLSMYTKTTQTKLFSMNEAATKTVSAGVIGLELVNTPTPSNSLMLFLNGQLLTQGSDYTLTGKNVSVAGSFIQEDDVVLATYSYLS